MGFAVRRWMAIEAPSWPRDTPLCIVQRRCGIAPPRAGRQAGAPDDRAALIRAVVKPDRPVVDGSIGAVYQGPDALASATRRIRAPATGGGEKALHIVNFTAIMHNIS